MRIPTPVLGGLLLVLNGADAATTLYLVQHRGAQELNPFMSYLIEVSPLLFICVKGILLGLVAAYLQHQEARRTLALACTGYGLIVSSHLIQIFFL